MKRVIVKANFNMMNAFKFPLLLLSLIASSCNFSDAEKSKIVLNSNSGKVISIIDGDTYDILLSGNKTVRIRMEGIDAPEKGMPFYKAAKKHLSVLCFGKTIRLEVHDEDSRKRKIAFSYLEDGRELSHEMIKAGMAWHFTKYNNDADLAKLESEARELKIGLWLDESPMPPWVNRSLHRNGVSTKDSFNIKEGQE